MSSKASFNRTNPFSPFSFRGVLSEGLADVNEKQIHVTWSQGAIGSLVSDAAWSDSDHKKDISGYDKTSGICHRLSLILFRVTV